LDDGAADAFVSTFPTATPATSVQARSLACVSPRAALEFDEERSWLKDSGQGA
jgi:hypothetical protein